MKQRTPKRALLLLIAAANTLLGGSWYLDGRLLPRLQGGLQRASATAKLLLWEKAPQLGDLLGLAEPRPPAPQPAAVLRPPAPLPRGKTAEELRVETLIDAVFQEYFRDYSIGGRTLTEIGRAHV